MQRYRVALVALVSCGAAAPVVGNARLPVWGMFLGILTGVLIAYHGMYWVRHRQEVQAWRYLVTSLVYPLHRRIHDHLWVHRGYCVNGTNGTVVNSRSSGIGRIYVPPTVPYSD